MRLCILGHGSGFREHGSGIKRAWFGDRAAFSRIFESRIFSASDPQARASERPPAGGLDALQQSRAHRPEP